MENKTKFINEIAVYVDGCSKGNPGPGGVGVVIINPVDGFVLFQKGFYIEEGNVTNQDAEFYAVLKGLQIAPNYCRKKIKIYSDSQLVIKELNREFRIHKEQHRKFVEDIMNKKLIFDDVCFIEVPRENRYIKIADRFATKAVEATRKGQ